MSNGRKLRRCAACTHLDTPSGLCPYSYIDGAPIEGECPDLCREPGTHTLVVPGAPPVPFCREHFETVLRKLTEGTR